MKTKTFTILFLALILFIGCDRSIDKNGANRKNKSDFKLASNFYEFSDKMENGDTLKIIVNLSVCMWNEYDLIELTKTNESIYLELKEKVVMDQDTFRYPKKLYKFQENNTNLEKMIFEFDIDNREEINSPFYIISNPAENDTIFLRTEGLSDRIDKIEKYQRFIETFYPNEMQKYKELYQTPPPPPK